MKPFGFALLVLVSSSLCIHSASSSQDSPSSKGRREKDRRVGVTEPRAYAPGKLLSAKLDNLSDRSFGTRSFHNSSVASQNIILLTRDISTLQEQFRAETRLSLPLIGISAKLKYKNERKEEHSSLHLVLSYEMQIGPEELTLTSEQETAMEQYKKDNNYSCHISEVYRRVFVLASMDLSGATEELKRELNTRIGLGPVSAGLDYDLKTKLVQFAGRIDIQSFGASSPITPFVLPPGSGPDWDRALSAHVASEINRMLQAAGPKSEPLGRPYQLIVKSGEETVLDLLTNDVVADAVGAVIADFGAAGDSYRGYGNHVRKLRLDPSVPQDKYAEASRKLASLINEYSELESSRQRLLNQDTIISVRGEGVSQATLKTVIEVADKLHEKVSDFAKAIPTLGDAIVGAYGETVVQRWIRDEVKLSTPNVQHGTVAVGNGDYTGPKPVPFGDPGYHVVQLALMRYQKKIHVDFPRPFTHPPESVVASIGDTSLSGELPDAFAIKVVKITASGFDCYVHRCDAPGSWSLPLTMSWIAVGRQ